MQKLHILSGIMFLCSLTLYSQDNLTFGDWDADSDNKIEKYEFISKFIDEYYNDLDNIDDEGLDDEDFYYYTYEYIDGNDDGLISTEEWDNIYAYVDDEFIIYNGLVYYDYDEDGFIDYDEYYDALYDTSFYLTWDIDKDGYINEYELAETVFENWDMNDSGTLSRSEYNTMDIFYLEI